MSNYKYAEIEIVKEGLVNAELIFDDYAEKIMHNTKKIHEAIETVFEMAIEFVNTKKSGDSLVIVNHMIDLLKEEPEFQDELKAFEDFKYRLENIDKFTKKESRFMNKLDATFGEKRKKSILDRVLPPKK